MKRTFLLTFICLVYITCKENNKMVKADEWDISVFHMYSSAEEKKYGDVETIIIKEKNGYYVPLDSIAINRIDTSHLKSRAIDKMNLQKIKSVITFKNIDSLSRTDYTENCGVTKNEFFFQFKSSDTTINFFFKEIRENNGLCKCEPLLNLIEIFEELRTKK